MRKIRNLFRGQPFYRVNNNVIEHQQSTESGTWPTKWSDPGHTLLAVHTAGTRLQALRKAPSSGQLSSTQPSLCQPLHSFTQMKLSSVSCGLQDLLDALTGSSASCALWLARAKQECSGAVWLPGAQFAMSSETENDNVV